MCTNLIFPEEDKMKFALMIGRRITYRVRRSN